MKNNQTLIVIAIVNLLVVSSIAVTVKDIYDVLTYDYTIVEEMVNNK